MRAKACCGLAATIIAFENIRNGMEVLLMLITKVVEVALNSRNISAYESIGYEIPKYWDKKHQKMSIRRGTKIVIKTEDLSIGSHVKVDVACDYCGCIKHVSYKDYVRNHDIELGDCCVKCRPVKHRRTMLDKYGVVSSFEIPGMIDKIKSSNQEKYECDWPTQSREVQEKSRRTMIEKYGVEHALQSEEILSRAIKTRCSGNGNPTSKPQLELSHLLLDMYGNCEIEVPCGRCSLDCVVFVDGILIDVEYDGWFWHQDKNRDARRDNFVRSMGYKILRVKGNKKDLLPTQQEISEKVYMLLHGYNYVEIQMQ